MFVRKQPIENVGGGKAKPCETRKLNNLSNATMQ